MVDSIKEASCSSIYNEKVYYAVIRRRSSHNYRTSKNALIRLAQLAYLEPTDRAGSVADCTMFLNTQIKRVNFETHHRLENESRHISYVMASEIFTSSITGDTHGQLPCQGLTHESDADAYVKD